MPPELIKPQITVQINEFGELVHQGQIVSDIDVLEEFFSSLNFLDNNALCSIFHGSPCLVEFYDEPLVANQVNVTPLHLAGELAISYPMQFQIKSIALPFSFSLESLSLDEWDRFHGYTHDKIPFVFSAKAQDNFFNLLDSFNDESVTWKQKEYPIPTYWDQQSEFNEVSKEHFWSQFYRNNEINWDLGAPTPGLTEVYPSLKLPVSRIAVLGGGAGHDAAYLASQGHHVTLFDISPEAIQRAKQKYSQILHHLHFVEADAFALPSDLHGQFDLIFEHTFYCAIEPKRRQELVRKWRLLLHEQGQLLGVFFTMEKRNGPPFGASEWEIRARLQKDWQILKWIRFQKSAKNRWGKELVVLAQKK